MEYSTTELVNVCGSTPSTVIKALTRAGFSPIRVGPNGVKIWQEECLEYILQRQASKELEESYISLPYLAHKYNLTNQLVRDILSQLNIEPAYQNHKKVEFYDKNVDEIINQQISGEHCSNADEHPLVTDKRWLKLSNWPNTVPSCFEDLDEEIN